MMKKYVFLIDGTEKSQSTVMYSDLVGVPNVTILSIRKEFDNKIINKLYNVSHALVRRQIPGAFVLKKIWQKYEDISCYTFCDDVDTVVVMNDIALDYYSINIFERIKKKNPRVKFVLFWLNAIETGYEWKLKLQDRLDPVVVLTDEEYDAKTRGWVFWMDPFSDKAIKKNSEGNGVMFAGLAKDRANKLLEIYEILKSNDIKCDFTVPDIGDCKGAEITTRYLDYEELLERVINSDCVLELMQSGQRGYTSRFQEAVVLNKKLITDSKEIVNTKYYSPKFIQIINDAKEIDIEFVNKKIDVDYKYEGDWSPLNVIKYLDSIVQ